MLPAPGARWPSAGTITTVVGGGEVGLRGAARGWRWDASYAFVSISDRLDASAGAAWAGFRRGTPTHVVRLGGGYSWGRFEADMQGRWQSRYRDYAVDTGSFSVAPVAVSDYVQFDARLGYKPTGGLTVALTANQFNASRLAQTAGRPVERRVFLTLSARL